MIAFSRKKKSIKRILTWRSRADAESEQEQAAAAGNANDTAAALKAIKKIGRKPARKEPFEHIWDNANHILVMLIAAVTVLSTVLAFLQSDSGSRSSENGRNAQTRALLMLQNQVGGLMDTDYETSLYQTWTEINSLSGMDYRLASETDDTTVSALLKEFRRPLFRSKHIDDFN